MTVLTRSPRFLALLCCTMLASFCSAADDDSTILFERDIRPIFRAHCYDCHGAGEEMKGKLDLRLVRSMQQGGETGPAMIPGKPAESYFLERIKSGEMPPGDHRVPADQVAVLEKWVAAGAPTARPEPESIGRGLGISEEERGYWAFRPIGTPQPPTVDDPSRARNAIDLFLLARMKEKGLQFSSDADRATLIKRVYLNLVGLPPTLQQVQQFIDDSSDNAYDQLVDQLLASDHYGERWGRHWLDVAGYADSEGYTNNDSVRKYAYKYRNYVIQSFNDDLPFDQFIQEQLAGDEMIEPPQGDLNEEQIRRLTATGFLRMAVDGTAADLPNAGAARNQIVADTIKIVSSSLLGISVGCARCHDHRYDPISHDDYHRMRAVFEPTFDWKQWRNPSQRQISLYTEADRQRRTEVQQEINTVAAQRDSKRNEYIRQALEKEYERYEEPLREQLRAAKDAADDKRTDEQKALLKDYPSLNVNGGNLYQYNQGHADEIKEFDAKIGEIRKKIPVEEFLRVANEVAGQRSPTYLFYRGDHRQPKHEITPGGLTVTAPEGQRLAIEDDNPQLPTSGRRLAYAQWLTNGQHPLVARVLVNRIWLHHFGQGIVSTPDEFGKLGSLPTHPELLTWLAAYFMENNWSLKQLHRLMVTSTAYRQSSDHLAEFDNIDGANSYYWRKSVQRLDAEIIRDRILAVSGKLDATMLGNYSAVKMDDSGQVVVGDSHRRSVYVEVRRTQPAAVLQVFDAPVMTVNCSKRTISTDANQSLMLMNSDFILNYAAAFAARVNQHAEGMVDAELVKDIELGFDPAEFYLGDPWSYGYGFIPEPAEGKLAAVNFTHYPTYDPEANRWQGGEKVPENPLGYSLIHPTGGHTGADQFCSIRRWTAPRSGEIEIQGTLAHTNQQGDGVELVLYSSRLGQQGRWTVHASNEEFKVSLKVEQGDQIDMVVSKRDTISFDSFQLTYQVDMALPNSDEKQVWQSEKDFHGPLKDKTLPVKSPIMQQAVYAWQLAYARSPNKAELDLVAVFLRTQLASLVQQNHEDPAGQAMTNYCQVLMSSNEFLYTD